MTIAIAFLGLNPQVELIDFYKTVDRVNHDIYYFIDNNENKLFIDAAINFIKIDDELCMMHGFHSFNHIGRAHESGKILSARDKAIFYFC